MQFGTLKIMKWRALIVLPCVVIARPECVVMMSFWVETIWKFVFYATLSTCRFLQTRSNLSNIHNKTALTYHGTQLLLIETAYIILLHVYRVLAFASCRSRNDVEVVANH